MRHTMHVQPGVAKQPNIELKTRPKQLLGSLPLVIALPAYDDCKKFRKLTSHLIVPLSFLFLDPSTLI